MDGLPWDLVGLAIGGFALAGHLAATLAALRVRRRRPAVGGPEPRVSILKPLCGVDDRLEENLETFFRIDYASYEVVLGAAAEDPALEVARRVAARHPEVPSRVTSGELAVGLNPKVRLLAHMTDEASGELVVVSDSNVRVRPSWLRETVAELGDPSVAVVSNLVAGVGERSVGATLENLQLNGFIAPAVCLGLVLRRPPCLIGKSMTVRREDLEAVGGWKALRGVLAEDYLLGRLLEARGRLSAVSSHVVETVNERWSLGRFLERHDRWLKMRWRISPLACVLEMATNVTAMALLWVVLSGGSATAVLGALALVAGRIALEAVSTASLRGWKPRRLAGLWLVPVRDLALALLWVHSRFSCRIQWRGGPRLAIGRGTVLSVPAELERADRPAPAPLPRPAARPGARPPTKRSLTRKGPAGTLARAHERPPDGGL